jgi:hypothetical protein
MRSWRFKIEAAICLLAASIGLWKIGELRPRWMQLHSAHQKLLEQVQPLKVIDPDRPQVRLRSREGFDFLFDCYLPVGNGSVVLRTSQMEQRQSLLGNKPQWAMFRIRLEPGDPQSFLFYAGPQGFSRTTLALGSHALLLMENPETVQVELPGYGQDVVLDDPEKPLPLLSLSIDPVSDDRSNTTAKRTAIFQAELQWE